MIKLGPQHVFQKEIVLLGKNVSSEWPEKCKNRIFKFFTNLDSFWTFSERLSCTAWLKKLNDVWCWYPIVNFEDITEIVFSEIGVKNIPKSMNQQKARFLLS